MKYAWIQEHRDSYPVSIMCRVLEVSKSGFYRSLSAQPSPRTQRTQRIQADVQGVFDRFDGIYGSHKIAHQLQQDDRMDVERGLERGHFRGPKRAGSVVVE